MLITSCLLALVVCQAESKKPPEVSAPDAPKPYAQLDTMRRMLQRQIEARRGEILVAPGKPGSQAGGGPAGIGGSYGEYPPGGGAASVTNDLLNSVYTTTSVGNSHAEYVPGLGAVFSLTVPVRTEWIVDEEKPAGETEAPHAASKNVDDAAWEELARGDAAIAASRSDFVRWAIARDGSAGKNAPAPRRQRFTARAVDALHQTLLDTIWRFGHKLELSSGERIAVVVQVQPANSSRHSRNTSTDAAARLFDLAARGYSAANVPDPALANSDETLAGVGGTPGGTVTDPNGDPVNGALVTADFDQDGSLDAFWRAAAYRSTPVRGFRLVIQVSAEDLNGYRAGSLDRDDMQKRTRVQRFTSPAGEVTPASLPGGGAR